MSHTAMSPDAQRILTDALALSNHDRAALADELLASLAPIDPEIDRRLAEEAEARVAAYQKSP